MVEARVHFLYEIAQVEDWEARTEVEACRPSSMDLLPSVGHLLATLPLAHHCQSSLSLNFMTAYLPRSSKDPSLSEWLGGVEIYSSSGPGVLEQSSLAFRIRNSSSLFSLPFHVMLKHSSPL